MSKWIKNINSGIGYGEIEARVICFPFAGGGADSYNNFPKFIDNSIEVCPVLLPGRGERYTESSIEDMAELLVHLSEMLRELSDKPFWFFGHSMGAIIAYQLACFQEFGGRDMPSGLILSARGGDKFSTSSKGSLKELANLQVEKMVSSLNVELDKKYIEQLKKVIMKTLLSDINLCGSSIFYDDRKITVPIYGIYGSDDEYATAEEIYRWKERTTKSVTTKEVTGDHFFIVENISETCKFINKAILEK